MVLSLKHTHVNFSFYLQSSSLFLCQSPQKHACSLKKIYVPLKKGNWKTQLSAELAQAKLSEGSSQFFFVFQTGRARIHTIKIAKIISLYSIVRPPINIFLNYQHTVYVGKQEIAGLGPAWRKLINVFSVIFHFSI